MRNTRVLVVAALFAALSAPTASAYLWESQAQIEERYGQPIKTTGYPNDRAYTYAFENFQIEIKFFDHVSHEETYSHSDRKTALSDSDIQRILDKFSRKPMAKGEGERLDSRCSPRGRPRGLLSRFQTAGTAPLYR